MRKRIKKRLLVGLLALLLLPLSGCFDAVDMGDQVFAVNLALDTGKGNALRLTVQFPQITPTGKAEGSSGGEESELAKDGYLIEQVEGENFSACMALLRMVTPRSVDLNQLRGVFLSEALSARPELLRRSLASILTAHGARPTAYVFLTRGRAEDVLAEQTPLFGARLSKSQAAQTRELTQRGVAPQITLSTFYARLTTPGRSAAAALCAVNGMQYLDSPPPHGAQYTAYLAGELSRNTANAVDICGSAVFAEDEVFYLDGYETQLCNLLSGEMKRISLVLDGRAAAIQLKCAPRLSVRLPESPEEPPVIRVRAAVRCDEADAGKYVDALRQDVASLLIKCQQWGADPVGFCERARMRVWTLMDWEALDWPELYRKAVFEIDIR